MERKSQSLRELVAIAEQYLTAYYKKLSIRDFSSKKSVSAPRQEVKDSDVSSETTRGIKCFIWEKLGYRVSEYLSQVQDRNAKRNFCYRCGENGHTFTQCKKN